MKRIIFLGLILSIGAFVETARVYGTASFIARQMVEVRANDERFNSRITELAKDSHCNPDFIQLVVNRMGDMGEEQTAKIAMANNVTRNALIKGVLWLLVIFVFVFLLLKVRQLRINEARLD